MSSSVYGPQGVAHPFPPTTMTAATGLANGSATTTTTDGGLLLQGLAGPRICALVRPEREAMSDVRLIDIPASVPRSSWPPRPRTDAHVARQPLGDLTRFPDELLLATVGFLDFQSLDRLRQISRRARDIIESLEVWRELLRHAPAQLHALHRTGLLGLHRASDLLAALRSSACGSCRTHFGGFLFLLTCERACLSCLRENVALRLTTPDRAARCFSLSPDQVARLLPHMTTIPQRRYSGALRGWYNVPTRLVSVRHAKELSLALHGGELPPPVEPARTADGRLPTSFNPLDPLVFASFRDAPLEAPARDLSLEEPLHAVPDDFMGAAIVRMPSLRGGGAGAGDESGCCSPLDHGVYCDGCQKVRMLFEQGMLPGHAALELFPPGIKSRRRVVEAGAQRLWSTEGFVDHVAKCYGAQILLQSMPA
ncbi:hypothetical protein RB601_003235 [Gaeumannomyces tritici]